MRMRFAFVLAALALLSGCEKDEEATAEAAPPPPVRVAEVERREVTPTAEAIAEIRATRTATLRAEAPGRVTELLKEPGDHVELGDVIARLDGGRTEAALRAANANVGQARARLDQAARQRTRAERLVAAGGAATGSLDDARDAERLARAAVRAARAQTGVTRRGLTDAELRAPFSGTLIHRTVEVGEFVAPGAPLVTIVDATELEANVMLDPRDALDVPVGARAQVTVHARAGETFQARVIRVSEVIDPRTRRLPVELSIEDPSKLLRPGLMGRFVVETGPPRVEQVISDAAVFERFGQQYVYVVGEDSLAQRRVVSVSRVRNGEAFLTDGVEEGARVIVAGLDRVVHERAVHVVAPLAQNGGEDEAREAEPAAVETP